MSFLLFAGMAAAAEVEQSSRTMASRLLLSPASSATAFLSNITHLRAGDALLRPPAAAVGSSHNAVGVFLLSPTAALSTEPAAAAVVRSTTLALLAMAAVVLLTLQARKSAAAASSSSVGQGWGSTLRRLSLGSQDDEKREIQLSEKGHDAYAQALEEHGDVVVIPRHGRMEYVVDYAHVRDVLTDAQHYSFEKAVTAMLHMEFMMWFKKGTFVQELDKLVQDGVTPRLKDVIDKIAPVFAEDVAKLFEGREADEEVIIEDSYQFCHHAIARAMVILILGERYEGEAMTQKFMRIVGSIAHLAGIYENTQTSARFPKLYATMVTLRTIFGTVVPVYFFDILSTVWSNRQHHLSHGIDVDSRDYAPFFDLLAVRHHNRRTGKLSALNFLWCAVVVLGIIFASVHQSAVIAAWCVVNLAARKEYQEEIRDEVDEHLEMDAEGRRTLTVETLRRAEKLDSFIRETMRTMGSLFAPVRYTVQPVRVGKYMLPKNALVAPYVRRAHEHPANYGDQGRIFDGRRWVGQRACVTGTPEFITFGLGRWACPGRHLAVAELKMITATLFDAYDVQLVDGDFGPNDPMNCTSVGPRGVLKLRRRRHHQGHTSLAA